jgi:transcriptional regulator with XRE-family HTH domain
LASHSFGTRLKAERESRGFTLVQISDATKIPQALLEALERDDLSRWPKGLYRRAFFRSYVKALGAPAEPLVLAFARLFPDDAASFTGPNDLAVGDPDAAEAIQPLALSWAGPSTAHRMLRSTARALLEVLGVAVAGVIVARLGGLRLFEGIGAVALVYLPVIRVAAERRRAWHLVKDHASAERRRARVVSSPAVEPAVTERDPPLADAVVEQRRPIAAGLATTVNVVVPVARRTGHLLKGGAAASGRASLRGSRVAGAFLARISGAAGVRLSVAGRELRRVTARACAVASDAFWRGVRSVAEHAELLASRQLNRTGDRSERSSPDQLPTS